MAAEIRSWDDLPEECWEMILTRLNQQHHESVSIVCKRFLTISNRLRFSFTITDLTLLYHRSISPLLHRFRHLKRISAVGFHGDLNTIVREIADSNLSLEALHLSNQKRIPLDGLKELGAKMGNNSFKSLICSRLCVLEDSDLKVIGASFPALEELDISYPEQEDIGSFREFDLSQSIVVTDDGVEGLASSFPNLRKINLSGNHFISDRSLVAIASNCKLLSEIAVWDCSFISQHAIGFIMRFCPNLSSLSVNGNKISSSYSSSLSLPSNFTIESSLLYAKALRVLNLSHMIISDEFLLSIKLADLPLQKLVLSHCQGFTFIGIASLVHVYLSLEVLDLEGVDFLTDHDMEILSQYLHNLTSVNLNSCSNLTGLTFFTLLKRCPSLEEIRMERTSLGKEKLPTDCMKSPSIQSLKLGYNKTLTDESLEKLVFNCPRLRLLDVSRCCLITERVMQAIGESCKWIADLRLNGCIQVGKLGKDVFSKLKVLRARGSGLDDEALSVIARNCSELKYLDLEGCFGVSDRGVKEVVEKCKRLKELSLKYCDSKSDQLLAWMVFTRPSLRKVIPPFGVDPSEVQRDLFFRHGCLVGLLCIITLCIH